MLASYRGHVEIVELLLMYDSDVNLTTQVKIKSDICIHVLNEGSDLTYISPHNHC